MNVIIYGFNAIGIFLGGLLSLKEHKISFINPGKKENMVTAARIIMPTRWIKMENIKYSNNEKADFIFICPDNELLPGIIPGIANEIKEYIGTETEVIILNSIDQQWKEQWKAFVTFALPLFELSMLQEDQVELFPGNPVIVAEKNVRLKKFTASIKQPGLKFLFTENISPYYHAFNLYNLIYLPVALANTTLGNFLSYPEGQKILENILTEGMQIFEQSGIKMAGLPNFDPKKLLNAIQKKPWQFSIKRFLPNRNYNPILQKLILKEQNIHITNTQLLKISAETGIELFWNKKVVNLLQKLQDTGFYKNPVELLKAIE